MGKPQRKSYDHALQPSGAGTGGGQGGHWPPQYLADQYSNRGRAYYPHLLLMAPQIFPRSDITGNSSGHTKLHLNLRLCSLISNFCCFLEQMILMPNPSASSNIF